MRKFKIIPVLIGTFVISSLFSRDKILEFKGAYFLPTGSRFKDCYKGSVLYGPEFTFQLCEHKNWYGFISVDYFKQTGRLLTVCDSTIVHLLPLAIGTKYFIPITCRADFYLGLGLQLEPVWKKIKRGCVISKKTFWGFGGIGKIGTYINLPHNFLLDLFVDYSFVWTTKTNFFGPTVTPQRTNLSGAIFGCGLGYRF